MLVKTNAQVIWYNSLDFCNNLSRKVKYWDKTETSQKEKQK